MNSNSTTPDQSGFDSILASLIEAQERAKDRPVDVNAWTEKYPQYAAQIHSFFANRGRLEEVLGPRAEVDAEAPTIGATTEAGKGQRIRYFGDYELLSEIARGGMGVVFKARQVSLNRVVAVKMILSGNLAGPSDVQRFHAEAESAANLDHPHIVPIYEVGEHEGQHYFSMKLIEGSSLSTAKNNRPKSETAKEQQRWAAALVAQVTRAVHHAHQRGILHRDLKPGNILIDHHSEPHVTDFGLAKKVEGGSDLTNTGAIVGTPAYMAPEQARSEKGLSTAVDVYSLGAILYELLTGRPPFKAETPLDTILEVLETEPARPRSILSNINRDLETISLKCLEKEPTKRYSSAEALADELERWGRGEPITARPVGNVERVWRWSRRNKLATNLIELLLLFGLGAGTLAWWAIQQADATQEQLEENQIAEGFSSLEEKDDLIGFGLLARPLLSEQSSKARAETHRERLQLLWPILSYPKIITMFSYAETDSIYRIVKWSDDRRYLASVGTGRSGTLFDLQTGKAIKLSVDKIQGRIIGADSISCKWYLHDDSSNTIELWDHSSRVKSTPITLLYPFNHFNTAIRVSNGSALSIHPDRLDSSLEYMNQLTKQLMTDTYVQVYDLDSNKPSNLMRIIPEPIRRICVMGDQFLMVSWHDRIASVWDARSAVRLAGPLTHAKKIDKAELSANGTRLITVSGREVNVWDVSNRQTPLASWKVFFEPGEIAISPDGRFIAIQDGIRRLYILEASTGELATSKIPSNAKLLRFSPDGRIVLTISSVPNVFQLWDLGSTQLDLHKIITGPKPLVAVPSSNGQYVVVLTTVKGDYDTSNGYQIFLYNNNGMLCHKKVLSPSGSNIIDVNNIAVNSTGSRIAYSCYEGGNKAVIIESVVDVDGNRKYSDNSDFIRMLRFDNNCDSVLYDTSSNITKCIDHITGKISIIDTCDNNLAYASVDNGKIWCKRSGKLIAPVGTDRVPMKYAWMSRNGSLVTSIDHEDKVHLFNMPHLTMKSNEDWRSLLDLYANWWSDFRLGRSSTGHQRLLNEISFQELKSKYPADFSVTPEQARHWRLQQIADCCKERNLPAALFHQNWLLAEAVLEAAKKK